MSSTVCTPGLLVRVSARTLSGKDRDRHNAPLETRKVGADVCHKHGDLFLGKTTCLARNGIIKLVLQVMSTSGGPLESTSGVDIVIRRRGGRVRNGLWSALLVATGGADLRGAAQRILANQCVAGNEDGADHDFNVSRRCSRCARHTVRGSTEARTGAGQVSGACLRDSRQVKRTTFVC